MHTLRFFPLALVLATIPVGCQTRPFSKQKASIGIPTAIAVTYSQTSRGLEFTFQSKDKTGSPVNVTRSAQGSPYTSIQFFKDSSLRTPWGPYSIRTLPRTMALCLTILGHVLMWNFLSSTKCDP